MSQEVSRLGRLGRCACLALAAAALAACGGVRVQSPIAAVSGPPATFSPTTSDIRTTRVVDLRDGLTKAAAFRAATDLLTQKYSVDVSDQKAGFLMTPWQTGASRQGGSDFHYRTRVIIRFLGDDWKQASIRAEANWQHDDGWDVGVDTKLLDDVAADLTTRIGVVSKKSSNVGG
jgi:hypothetical protein